MSTPLYTNFTNLTCETLFVLGEIMYDGGLFNSPTTPIVTGGAVLAYNEIVVESDGAAVPSGVTKVDGLSVRHKFGGVNSTGGRHAGEFRAIQTAPTSASNTDRNYVGLAGYFQSNTGDGGTPSIARGAGFGGNFVAVLADGVQDYLNLGGVEINTRAGAGSTVRRLAGLQLHHEDKVQASSVYDCSISISAKGVAAVGRKTGILFSDFGGQQPIDVAGTVIGTIGASTVANLIDCSSYTITGNYLLSQDWVWNANALRPISNNTKTFGVPTFNVAGVYSQAYYSGANQVLNARKTGWAAPSETNLNRSDFTYTAPTIAASYTQAQIQGLADNLQQLTRAFNTLKRDLHAATSGHGLIGA